MIADDCNGARCFQLAHVDTRTAAPMMWRYGDREYTIARPTPWTISSSN